MKAVFNGIGSFFKSPSKLYLFLLCLLLLTAVWEFYSMGVARRTFVFSTLNVGEIAVEDRMLKQYASKEENIIRYTEETLQGPVTPKDLLPLFPLETKLKTLMLRGKTVYINFTESAALPLPDYIKKGGGGNVLDNFRTLHDSILRNFSYVSDVLFFIEGNEIFLDSAHESDYKPDVKADLPDKMPET